MKISPFNYQTKNNTSFSSNRSKKFERYLMTLEEKDREVIKEEYSKSEFYNPIQYAKNFMYFRNLKNEINEPIIVPYKRSSVINILKVNPCSLDASYLEIVFDLIKQGKINQKSIRRFADNFKINPYLKQDIDLYCDVVSKNDNSLLLEEELLNAQIPTFKNKKEGVKNCNIGDIFKIKNEKFIQIKHKDNSSKEIKLSKENCLKLFPLFDRYMTTQGSLGDCYLIESLLAVYSNPNKRHIILEMFEEKENGDIMVNFPKRKHYTIFKNGELPKDEIEERYSRGAKGYRLIEYAWGDLQKQIAIDGIKKALKKEEKKDFENFIKKHKNEDIFVTILPKTITARNEDYLVYDTFKNAKKEGLIDFIVKNFRPDIKNHPDETFVEFLISNGGDYKEVMKELGFKKFAPENPKISKKLLNSKTLMDKAIALFSIDMHAYSANKTNECLLLFDPHCQGFPTKTNSAELLEKSEHIRFFI